MPKNLDSIMDKKEFKRFERKVSQLTQKAYIEQTIKKYEEELSHVVTEDDRKAFIARWEGIADKLDEGWILDMENI